MLVALCCRSVGLLKGTNQLRGGKDTFDWNLCILLTVLFRVNI